MRLFANDTNIFISCKDPVHLRNRAEQCLKDIKAWLNSNRLILSEEKTQYSIFMPCKRKVPNNLNKIHIDNKIMHAQKAANTLVQSLMIR